MAHPTTWRENRSRNTERIKPAFAGGYVGDVADIDPIRLGHLKLPIQVVRRHRQAVVRVRGYPKPPASLAMQPLLAQQPPDPGTTDLLPLLTQGILDTSGAIGLATGLKGLRDLRPRLPIRPTARTFGATQPLIEPTAGHFENPTHPAHRKDRLMRLNKGVLHGAFFAKYAAAFLTWIFHEKRTAESKSP